MTITTHKNLIKIKQAVPGLTKKVSLLSALPLLGIVGFLLALSTTAASAASCVPPATTFGTDTMSVQQPTTSTYSIWVRVQTPTSTATAPLMLQTGTGTANSNPTCFSVGGTSTIPASTWTWVKAGTSALTAYSSTAANQTQVQLIGTQSGVEVDSVLFLVNASCTPTGTGTNCTTGQPVPSTPTLTATAASSTTVALKWTQSTDSSGLNVAGYYVFRGTTKVATITSASTLTYTDTVTSGSTNTYTVQAYDNSNTISSGSSVATSAVSNAVSVATGLTAPTGLTAAAASTTQVNLAWTASSDGGGPGIAGYDILRNGTNIASVSGTTTTYQDKTAVANTAYSYTVEAFDSNTPPAVSAASNTATVTTPKAATVVPTAPTAPKATATTDNSVTVTWTASTDTGGPGIGGYYIIRGGVTIGQVTSPTVTYTDATVKASTAYSYTIEAFDKSATPVVSPASTAATVTTPAATVTPPAVPTAPTNLTATAISSSQINLSWTASTATGGVTGYNVFRNGTQIATVTTTTYGNTGLTAATAYSYDVVATDATGSSKASNTATATTQAIATTTTATVEGTVTNSSTKAAIAGVSIHTGTHGTTAGAATTDTNSAGKYVLSNITTTSSHSYYYSDSGYRSLSFRKTFPAGINTVNEALTPQNHHHRG